MRLDRELTCSEIVEMVTAFFETRLSPDDTERFEEHLAFCGGCSMYLAQMRATVAATGRLRAEDIPAELQDRLLAAFREWKPA
jgi:anti-sigma factor RsiW